METHEEQTIRMAEEEVLEEQDVASEAPSSRFWRTLVR